VARDELRLDRVGDGGRIPVTVAEIAPLPVLEVRVAAEQPLFHGDAVDLLLEPFRELALHIADPHDGRNLLPVQNLNARHGGRRLTRLGDTGTSHVGRARAAACLAA